MSFAIEDYVDVAERLRLLREKHPDASLQGTFEVLDVAGASYIAYRAQCFRTPDDARPGVGCAWELVPGTTPFTRGSELQNAETSAWGRAIVAVLAADTKRIASADEMRLAEQRNLLPPEGFETHEVAKAHIEQLRARVIELELAPWVRDQGFAWPWSAEVCAAIAEKCDAVEAELTAPFAEVTT